MESTNLTFTVYERGGLVVFANADVTITFEPFEAQRFADLLTKAADLAISNNGFVQAKLATKKRGR